MILSFRIHKSGQTVQTQIRLLLENFLGVWIFRIFMVICAMLSKTSMDNSNQNLVHFLVLTKFED